MIVDREGRRLFGVAYTILRDAADAEDALQDAMVSAWRAWHKADRTNPTPWLTRIVVNQCLTHRRRASRTPETALTDREGAAASAERGVARVFAVLTRQQRAVVLLHYWYGYTLDQCAALMKCRPGTARSHLHRAIAALREELSDD